MSTKIGQSAEAAVADYLKARGFKIMAQNWRNRWCEIDLVARSKTGYRIIEVKFRRSRDFGDGFAYVTSKKQQRLRRAAEAYMYEHDLTGDFQIDVAAVTGDPNQLRIDYLENAVEAA